MLGHYFLLFVSLLLMMLLVPLSYEWHFRSVLLNILFMGVMFSGVYAASTRRWHFWLSMAFGGPWIVSTWIHGSEGGFGLHVFDIVMGTLFYIFTALVILLSIVRAKRVTLDVLFGAGTVYLLMGITGALLYVLVDTLAPASLVFPSQEYMPEEIFDFSKYIYFSFTTLTTLGYGDILPVRPLARAFTSLQAAMGVLYTTVVVAWLVGLFLSQDQKAAASEDIPVD
jgi:hypothetical protein